MREILPKVMGQASALSFLAVLMLFVPCAATVAAMKQEMGNWRWFLSSFVFMVVISFLAGTAAYHLALAVGLL